MLDLLVDRLRTPGFMSWVERDRVQLNDVRRAALTLKQQLQERIVALIPGTL